VKAGDGPKKSCERKPLLPFNYWHWGLSRDF